jgi:uncharacterized protein (TIGR03083 family)
MNDWLHALEVMRASHDRLSALVAQLDDAALVGPSYCDDWSIADVLSHLGSQAEIFSSIVEAVLAGSDPPGPEAFGPIWDRWNAKGPIEQARDAIIANEAFVSSFEALDEETISSLRIGLFGMELDAAALLRMKLGEHAVHSWDIAVEVDPAAVIPTDAAGLLIDGLADVVARSGRPTETARHVAIATSSPSLRLVLETEGVRLVPGDTSSTEALIAATAEQLIRLVYGRLDDDHIGQPPVVVQGISLEELRQVFPGF